MMDGDADGAERPELNPKLGLEGALASFFHFDELGTTLRTEIVAGVTAFVTMAYILVVNPAILSNAIYLQEPNDLFGELAIATAISAAAATLFMGLTANFPFALAPGMGLNAYFAFSVVLGMGIDWRVALAAVLVEGVLFIGLTLTNIRSQIVRAIPASLKRATAAGIGLFLAYIALSGDPAAPSFGAGIIVAHPATKTAIGSFSEPATVMAIVGLFLTAAFVARRIKGALLWGVLLTAAIGWLVGVAPWPSGIVAWPSWPADLIGQAFVGLAQVAQTSPHDLFVVVLVFLFVDLFDTIGTLSGLGIQAGYIDSDGELPRSKQALMADAVGTSFGAVMGTSTVTTFIESAAGIAEGGRSGFTAVVTAALFALSILFIPLLAAIPGFATVAALLMVGVLMMGNVAAIDWQDPAESIPAFLTIAMMPLAFSIAEGLAAGFVTYPAIKAIQGKGSEVGLAVWILAAVFALHYLLRGLGVM